MDKFVSVFKSLSDGTRLRILRLLIKADSQICICEIIDSLQLPQSNVSKHIRELKIAGLVEEKKEGRFVLYSVVKPDDRFIEMLLNTMDSISEDYFSEDIERLEKRLALRSGGKIVVGMTVR